MIRIEQLHKRFRKLQALHNVSASFYKGQVVALIGPNGSGKTTLIKSILGMVRPDAGSISFNGEPIDRNDRYRDAIGYMPQIGRYPDNMQIRQLFEMLQNIRNAAHRAVDTELYDRFAIKSIEEKTMSSLSGGTRQKVSAALAFLFNPEVLILDEPTAGLDPLASEILKEKILAEKKNGKLIIITSHILSDLDELTTHIMYLQEGKKVFFDTLEHIKQHTGEERLGRAIARIMQTGYPQPEQNAIVAPAKVIRL